MTNDYLDVRSPYIKSNIYSSIYDRKNNISLNQENLDRNSSDDFLKQKIYSISKRVVGDEIRKFSEIASREISTEFNNLENRIVSYTEKVKNELEKDIDKKVEFLGRAIGNELDNKIKDLNNLINQTENKLINLEKYSRKNLEKKEDIVSNIEKDDLDFKIKLDNNNIENNTKKIEEEYTNKNRIDNSLPNKFHIDSFPSDMTAYEEDVETHALKIEKENTKNLLESADKLILLENKEEKLNKQDIVEDKKIEQNLNKIISGFDKKGFLFSKNTFPSIKDLFITEILDHKVSSSFVDKKDLELIENILIDLISLNKSKIEYGETVEEYLRSVCK